MNETIQENLNISDEEMLLLRCARVELGDGDVQALEGLLIKQLDWTTILETARWHRLSGLLFHHLKNPLFIEKVPPVILEQMRGTYHYNVARYLFQRTELQKLLEALTTRGLPAIMLKGTVLEEFVYSSPGLRPKNDIDILVKEEHLDVVYQLISEMGYEPQCGDLTWERTRSEHRHLPLLEGANNRVWFEIHRHITRPDSPLHFDISDFWTHSRQAKIAGKESLALSPEHMLIHLCVHFFLDRQYRSVSALGQLCDVSGATHRYFGGPDWPLFISQVEKLGIARPIYYVLHWAKSLLDAPVPDPVLAKLKPEQYDEEATNLFARNRVLDAKEFMAHALVSTKSDYSLFTALGTAMRRLVPDRVTLAEQYGIDPGSKRIYSYYPIRWWKVLTGLARTAAKPSRLRAELSLDKWLHSALSIGDGTQTLSGGTQ